VKDPLYVAYAQLVSLQRNNISSSKDPIDEQALEIMQDLRAFTSRFDMRQFFKDLQENTVQAQKKARVRPWHLETRHKIDYTNAPLAAMRAQEFLSGALQDKKPAEIEFMICNLERMLEEYEKI